MPGDDSIRGRVSLDDPDNINYIMVVPGGASCSTCITYHKTLKEAETEAKKIVDNYRATAYVTKVEYLIKERREYEIIKK